MTSATISLNKKAYPLMMHLSILPQHNISAEQPVYDPTTQSSTFNTSMAGSWSTHNCTSPGGFTVRSDADTREDD
jgi:hypothetical protein